MLPGDGNIYRYHVSKLYYPEVRRITSKISCKPVHMNIIVKVYGAQSISQKCAQIFFIPKLAKISEKEG